MNMDLSPERVRDALTHPPFDVPAIRPRMLRRDRHDRVIPRPSCPPPGKPVRRAAVMVPLYSHRNQLWLAFTRRPDYLPRHSGQISFPGGRVEPADHSLLDTARREAQEELGIDPGSFELWKELKPIYITSSDYLVYPFVMYSPERPDFRPDPGEVAELIEVPLSTFLAPENFNGEYREHRGQIVWEPHFRYGKHIIWGATAIITDQIIAHLQPSPETQNTAYQ